jgi:hypothetical protein
LEGVDPNHHLKVPVFERRELAMSRVFERGISLLFVLFTSAALLAQEGAADAGAKAGPGTGSEDPQFEKASHQEEFQQSKELFAEGKYKEAERGFRKLRQYAKGKEDKTKVERWVQATAGGMLLEKVKKLKGQSMLQTYDQVQAYVPKYRETPARGLYMEFLAELEKEIFHPLETFDVRSRSYSKKYGKTFVNDARYTLDGTQCLRWQNTAKRTAAALKIQGPNVPKNWTNFSALEFWVYLRIPPRGAEAVIMCGQTVGKATARAKAASQKTGHFQAAARIAGKPGQWRRVRLPMSEFKPAGTASLDSVLYFQLQIPAGAQFDFLIDKIALIKRKAEARGGR